MNRSQKGNMNALGLKYINTVNCSLRSCLSLFSLFLTFKILNKELPKRLRCRLANQLLQEIEARKTLAQGLLICSLAYRTQNVL